MQFSLIFLVSFRFSVAVILDVGEDQSNVPADFGLPSTTAEENSASFFSDHENPQLLAQGVSVWPKGPSWTQYVEGFVDTAAAAVALSTSWAQLMHEKHDNPDTPHLISGAAKAAGTMELLQEQWCDRLHPWFLCCTDDFKYLIPRSSYPILKYCGEAGSHLCYDMGYIMIPTCCYRYEIGVLWVTGYSCYTLPATIWPGL